MAPREIVVQEIPPDHPRIGPAGVELPDDCIDALDLLADRLRVFTLM